MNLLLQTHFRDRASGTVGMHPRVLFFERGRRASLLPEEEQESFALFLLAELESERRWTELFAQPESAALLEELADETLNGLFSVLMGMERHISARGGRS